MPKRKRDDDRDNEPEKDWCFTHNNYTDDDLKLWERIAEDVSSCLITKEVAPSTGTPHLQGRVVFKRGYRFSQLAKQGWASHWEKTKAKQDNLYMIKKDSVIFIDKKKNQGKRSDLDAAIELAASGVSQRTMYQKHPATMVRYGRHIMEAAKILKEPETVANFKLEDFPNWEPITDWSKTHVLCGAAGIGKTEWACAHFANPLLVTEIDQLLDFDENEHDGIVFDDIDFKATKQNNTRQLQIGLTDQTMPRGIRCRYRTPVIPKHTKKIFTCNDWCLDVEDKAIQRRIIQHIAVDRDTPITTSVSEVTNR